MPTKKADAPTIHENHDGTVTVMYQPKQSGLHEMHIKHEGTHVQGIVLASGPSALWEQ